MVSTEWSRTTKRLVVVGLIIVLLLTLYIFRTLLPPVILAFVLAYILKPLADSIQRRSKMPRLVAVILVFLILLLVFSVVPATVVPYVVNQITRLNLNLQQLIADIGEILSQPIVILNFRFSLQEVVGIDDLQTAIQDLLQPFASQTINLLFNVASSLLWVISILIISFYLVKDADRLRTTLDRLAPPGYTEELRRLYEEINLVWKAFFRGQVVLGLIVGLMVWITMTAIGLPNAALMALLAGLLEVLPTFGPVLATIPALLIAFFLGSTYLPLSNFWFGVLVLAIYLFIQQTENAYLVPRIMGRRMQLHPVIIFIGALAGGLLAGALGVLLAAPVIGTVRVLLTYVYAKLKDEAPFPPVPEVEGEVYPGEIDAILFDLDGTLIETDDAAVDTLARTLGPLAWLFPRRNTHQIARRIIMSLEGPANSILALLDRVGLDDTMFDIGDRLRRMRGLHTPMNFRPVEGVIDTLHDLSRRYHLAIVTTRSRQEAEIFLTQQDLNGLIHIVVGREDTWRIKPHPSPVQHAADQLAAPVERCLMVGDTKADIWAARAAGARSAGVLCGFGEREELERAGADVVLPSTPDLVRRM
jgi:HAD superfamily hydrolase (TIGR01549 family)